MSKERDLKKAINEIKASLEKKDLESLKEQLLKRVDPGNLNISGSLDDSSLSNTLKEMMNNKNISDLLKNPQIVAQLSALLNSNENKDLIERLQEMFNNPEEKKNK